MSTNQVGQVLSAQQQFEKGVEERVRKDIGDLLPDEVLKALVEKAIQNVFFTRKTSGDAWNKREEPSWFEKTVQDVLQKTMQEQIEAYFKKNKNEMAQLIAQEVAANGPLLLGKVLSSIFANSMRDLDSQISYRASETVNQIFRNKGM